MFADAARAAGMNTIGPYLTDLTLWHLGLPVAAPSTDQFQLSTWG